MLKRLLVLLCFFPLAAFAVEFQAGKDYEVITTHQAQDKSKGVLEFFSYGCPWCFKVEKTLERWQVANKNVISLQRVPVVFNKNWEVYAKAYYLANILKKNAEIDPVLFKAIQVEKLKLTTPDKMEEFLIKQGLDKDLVKSAFSKSPTMDAYINQGNAQMVAYQINAVPAFIVNGQYKTDLQMAGNPERLMAILSYLSNVSNPRS